MKPESKKFLLKAFIFWRILLFALLFFAVGAVSLQQNFLGGDLAGYLKAPYLWAWANFDGEHYLSIAYQGYLPLTYFYFPAYPLITRFFANLFNQSFSSLAISGFLVSNISLFLALIGFWKIIRLDFQKNIAKLTIILLLVFPTSFYFGSLYTESLFLALVIWSFYFARKQKWLLAGILGAVLTATRVVGITLVPALIVEVWLQKRKNKKLDLFWPIVGILLVPLGLFAYMYYLKVVTGDPLEFFHSVSIFGQQRSQNLILLPQVFYRYFFKVLPNLNYGYFPVVFTTFLEIVAAIVFLVLTIVSFFKLRLSYAFYLAAGYLIPTLSGSFSSLPRYVLVLFPGFILMAVWLSKKSRWLRTAFLLILFLALGIATALFVRGYWVA
jgi:Gpi18-like mannosyltransferase